MRTEQQLLDDIHTLQQHRLSVEISDDFAWSNGKLRNIDRQIANARRELRDLSGPSCQTQQPNDGAYDVA